MKLLPLLILAALPLTAAPIDPPILSQTKRGVELTVPLESGTWPFTYQWYRETGTLRKVRVKIPPPEGNMETLYLSPASQPGTYTCEITNSAGTVTSRPVKVSFTSTTSAPSIQVTIKKP